MSFPAKKNPVLFIYLREEKFECWKNFPFFFLSSCGFSCLFPVYVCGFSSYVIVRLPDSFSPGPSLVP